VLTALRDTVTTRDGVPGDLGPLDGGSFHDPTSHIEHTFEPWQVNSDSLVRHATRAQLDATHLDQVVRCDTNVGEVAPPGGHLSRGIDRHLERSGRRTVPHGPEVSNEGSEFGGTFE